MMTGNIANITSLTTTNNSITNEKVTTFTGINGFNTISFPTSLRINSSAVTFGNTSNGNNNSDTVVVGNSSLNNALQERHIAIGNNTLQNLITGQFNTVIGNIAGSNSTVGNSAVFIGDAVCSLYYGFGNLNTVIGAFTSSSGTGIMGQSNTIIGGQSCVSIASGSNNTVLGSLAGSSIILGNNLTLLGEGANVTTDPITNSIALGQGATVGSSNTAQIGNTSLTSILANTSCNLESSTVPFNELFVSTLTGGNGFFTNLSVTNFTGNNIGFTGANFTNLTTTNLKVSNVMTGNIMFSKNNTLDDGSGNMSIAGWLDFTAMSLLLLEDVSIDNQAGVGMTVQSNEFVVNAHGNTNSFVVNSNVVTTANNTLDDGSGNMNVIKTLSMDNQIADNTILLYSGGNVSNSYGFGVQAGQLVYSCPGDHVFYDGGHTGTTLFTIANTKAITTANNTLDNGSGMMTVNATLPGGNASIIANTTGSGQIASYVACELGGKLGCGYGYQTGIGVAIFDYVNNSVWLSQGGNTNKNVQTANNILDNGSGIMNISNYLVRNIYPQTVNTTQTLSAAQLLGGILFVPSLSSSITFTFPTPNSVYVAMGSPNTANYPGFPFNLCMQTNVDTVTFSLGSGWQNNCSALGNLVFNPGHSYNFIVVINSSTTATLYGGQN